MDDDCKKRLNARTHSQRVYLLNFGCTLDWRQNRQKRKRNEGKEAVGDAIFSGAR